MRSALNTLSALCAAAAVLVGATASVAAPAPRLSIANLSDLAVPDAPFDRSANADTAVRDAFQRARTERKLVLIDLGANWCADCRILAGIMALPELQRFLDAQYVVVNVDVGHFDRNLQIPAHWGFTERLEGVPIVLITKPDGTLVNAGHIAALVGSGGMEPQKVADWFAQWTP